MVTLELDQTRQHFLDNWHPSNLSYSGMHGCFIIPVQLYQSLSFSLIIINSVYIYFKIILHSIFIPDMFGHTLKVQIHFRFLQNES
jgi:hypothetical protein